MEDKFTVIGNAERFVANRQFERAVAEYQRLLEQHGDDPGILNTLGDLLLRVNRSEEALVYFHRVAEIFEQTGFSNKAAAIYRKILQTGPDDPDVLCALVSLNQKRGMRGEALRHMKRLLEVRLRRSEREAAEELIQEILQESPDDPELHRQWADLVLAERPLQASEHFADAARLFLNRNRREDALACVRSALELNPHQAAALSLSAELEAPVAPPSPAPATEVEGEDEFPTWAVSKSESFDTGLLAEPAADESSDAAWNELFASLEASSTAPAGEASPDSGVTDHLLDNAADEALTDATDRVEPGSGGTDAVEVMDAGMPEPEPKGVEPEILLTEPEPLLMDVGAGFFTEASEDLGVASTEETPPAPEAPELMDVLDESAFFDADALGPPPSQTSASEDVGLEPERGVGELAEGVTAVDEAEPEPVTVPSLLDAGAGFPGIAPDDFDEAAGEPPPPAAQPPELLAGVDTVDDVVPDPIPGQSPRLAEALDEVEFYLKLNLRDDAVALVGRLLEEQPGHPTVKAYGVRLGLLPETETASSFADEVEGILDELFFEPTAEASAEGVIPNAIPQESADTGEQAARSCYDLGLAYHEMGLVDDAAEKFEEAYGRFVGLGDTVQAADCCRLLCSCWLRSGEYRRAVEWADIGLSLPRGQGEEWLHLEYQRATALEHLGEVEESLAGYRAILGRDEDFLDVRAKVAALEAHSD